METLVQRPHAQSLKNFSYYSQFIRLAIQNMQDGKPTCIDTINLERTAETFGARFRDAVRYGILNNYVQAFNDAKQELYFTHSMLCDFQKWMKVSIIDAPRVWVFDRTKPEPWKQALQPSLEQTCLQPSQVTFSPLNFQQLHAYCSIKHLFNPSLVVRAMIELTPEMLNELDNEYDVAITPFGNEPNQWLLL